MLIAYTLFSSMKTLAFTLPSRIKQVLDEVVVTPTSGDDGLLNEAGCESKKNADPLVKKLIDNGPKPCRRCKEKEGSISMRGQPTCSDCFMPFIRLKVVKRLNTLHRDLGEAWGSKAPRQGKYLAGLSFGASSVGMLEMLDDNIKYLVDRGKGGIAYSVEAVHVDTSLDAKGRESAEKLVARYEEWFPKLRFATVGLEDILDIKEINWKVLGLREAKVVADGAKEGLAEERRSRVRDMLGALPSVSARIDILRLLVRHVLLTRALNNGVDAVVLGTNMTGLAEVTFAEMAKGRGVSVPWLTQDGVFPLPSYVGEDPSSAVERRSIPVYHLMRDIFRNEVVTFASLTSPPIVPLIPSLSPEALSASEKVISHKTLSIEEVIGKFFGESEAENSSVISNIVRTTTKLSKLAQDGDEDDTRWCEICGLALDGVGDKRWNGEIGLDEADMMKGICYGCQRSLTT